MPADNLVALLPEALFHKPPLHRVQVRGAEESPEEAGRAASRRAHGRALPRRRPTTAPVAAPTAAPAAEPTAVEPNLAFGIGLISASRGPLQTIIDILLGRGRSHRLKPRIGIEHGAFGGTGQARNHEAAQQENPQKCFHHMRYGE